VRERARQRRVRDDQDPDHQRDPWSTKDKELLIATVAFSLESLFQSIDKHARNVESRLLGNFDKTRRTCDVDFCQMLANHVQSHQQQPALGELGSERRRDIAIGLGQGLRAADAAEASFLRSIDALRISSGADWQSISPGAPVLVGTLTTINVAITVQGTESQLASYQNGLYDLQYILRMGLRPANCQADTMLLHHSLFPELQKGLGFLGSIYTNEASWKLMREQDSNKRDE